jgi:hypothetical protein
LNSLSKTLVALIGPAAALLSVTCTEMRERFLKQAGKAVHYCCKGLEQDTRICLRLNSLRVEENTFALVALF